MKFTRDQATFYVPDGRPEREALLRVTHLGIGAHQDDLEIFAYHGIETCFRAAGKGFLGVTVTDGSGSPRTGPYAGTTDEEMQAIRRREQNYAAEVGEYAGMIQLNHPSKAVKDPADKAVVEDLHRILAEVKPAVVYTHNPADKHDTHIGVVLKTIAALRALPAARRPPKVLGCEVWRALDWMLDSEKNLLDVGRRENLSAALLGVFDSQIAGGKRYDLATVGRWRANATYIASHATDTASALTYAMDLTPLIADPAKDVADYVRGYIERFSDDVAAKIRRCSGA